MRGQVLRVLKKDQPDSVEPQALQAPPAAQAHTDDAAGLARHLDVQARTSGSAAGGCALGLPWLRFIAPLQAASVEAVLSSQPTAVLPAWGHSAAAQVPCSSYICTRRPSHATSGKQGQPGALSPSCTCQSAQPVMRMQAVRAPAAQLPGMRALLPTDGGPLLTGSVDGCVRLWHGQRPELSYMVCGDPTGAAAAPAEPPGTAATQVGTLDPEP